MAYRYKQKEISNGQGTEKDCETTLDIRRIQIKNAWDSSLHMSEWIRSETQVTAYAGEDVDQGEHPSTVGTSINLIYLL